MQSAMRLSGRLHETRHGAKPTSVVFDNSCVFITGPDIARITIRLLPNTTRKIRPEQIECVVNNQRLTCEGHIDYDARRLRLDASEHLWFWVKVRW